MVLGHVTPSVAVYGYDEIKPGARDVPQEDLKNQVGARYDAFVSKLPAQMQVLVGLVCSHEKAEELAVKVWKNWLKLNTSQSAWQKGDGSWPSPFLLTDVV